MDIFLPILGLLMIMALVVGATIKINTLLISKSLTKILLIIASILSMFMIILLPIHYFEGTLTWGIFLSFLLISKLKSAKNEESYKNFQKEKKQI